jgi:hypothetical protein
MKTAKTSVVAIAFRASSRATAALSTYRQHECDAGMETRPQSPIISWQHSSSETFASIEKQAASGCTVRSNAITTIVILRDQRMVIKPIIARCPSLLMLPPCGCQAWFLSLKSCLKRSYE